MTSQCNMRTTLLFLLKLGAVLVETVPVLSNTAVVAGEKMTMNCPVTNDTSVRKWSFQNKSRVVSTIYLPSGGFHEDFKHFGVKFNANGPVTISANSTRSSDAGIYKCHCENDVTEDVYSAHLIVLDSLPVCESNLTKNYSYSLIEGDHIFIQCNINFRGFWAPSVEWTQHGDNSKPEGEPVADGIEQLRNSSQSITSKLTIAVNSSTNCSYYSCRIYFAKYDDTGVNTPKHAPEFTYTWNSSVIYVSHSSAESDVPETDAVASSAVTSSTEKSSNVDWYLVSLSMAAGMSIFFILLVVLAIAGCIRFKKKVSDHYASTTKETIELPKHEPAYDTIPYATVDNYETIGEEDTDPSVVLSSRPRLGPLPTPGYAGLMPVQPSAPAVYSRMESYATPEDIASDSTLMKVSVAIEHLPDKQGDELKTGKTESQSRESHRSTPTYLDVRE